MDSQNWDQAVSASGAFISMTSSTTVMDTCCASLVLYQILESCISATASTSAVLSD